jgi:hypothetical protein
MPIFEVAFMVCMTVEALRAALSHIHDLSYVTIRLAGLRLLFLDNSSEGREIGFLVNGSVFTILDDDCMESARLEGERQRLVSTIVK